MESFEQVCKVVLENEGYAVSGNVKFPIARRTRKAEYEEFQTHGYEVDLVGANRKRLILGEVKSYLGSGGVSRQNFRGLADESRRTSFNRYRVFNDPDLHATLTQEACGRYGYQPNEVEWRLYVGKFAKGHERDVTDYLAALATPVTVVTLEEITSALIDTATGKNIYVDDPVVMTVRALKLAGRLS